MTTLRICVFGAGAIGGLVAARLAAVPGVAVSVVARGAQLRAIRERGVQLVSPAGNVLARVEATDQPASLGPQDVVFIALKQHQVTAALPGLESLIGPDTVLVPPTTGIPYWYFHGLPGPHGGQPIDRLDPGGEQWCRLGPQRALGCVYWAAAEVLEPGVVSHDGRLLRFPIGEPDGSMSPRVRRLVDAMAQAGLRPEAVGDIRAWIWAKMISSLTWNPLAVVTGATLDRLVADGPILALARHVMREAEVVAEALGIDHWPLSLEDRIEAARQAGAHRMSMLQDMDRGRSLEIDVLTDSIAAMREIAGVATPTIDRLYALLRLRVSSASAARPSAPVC